MIVWREDPPAFKRAAEWSKRTRWVDRVLASGTLIHVGDPTKETIEHDIWLERLLAPTALVRVAGLERRWPHQVRPNPLEPG